MSMSAKVAALLALCLALAAGGWKIHHSADKAGYDRATKEWQHKTDAQKIEAAALLAVETAKAGSVTLALQALKEKQEITDAKAQKTNADIRAALRELNGGTGRLRDPNASAGCGASSASTKADNTQPTDSGRSDTTKADGLLSAQASGILRELMDEADVINTAYASCRADAVAYRATTQQ